MTSTRHRQRRLLLYETAFDSRVKNREAAEDFDGLIQVQNSPLFRGSAQSEGGGGSAPARAASRSSFGSTSGSSASSTPTHQPMEIARHAPPFTPTERRRVTLVRDLVAQPRSMSPQARPSAALRGSVVNRNFDRKISFISGGGGGHQWDNVSRCSGSDRSSSQESMNVELSSTGRNLGRSASRDSLNAPERRSVTSNYPNNWKELTSAKLPPPEGGNPPPMTGGHFQSAKDDACHAKKSAGTGHPGVKVLPTDNSNSNSPRFSRTKSSKSSCDLAATSQQPDPELKENNSADTPRKTTSRRPTLLSEVRPTLDNLPQSPENDDRTSEDYDLPWDLKAVAKRNTGNSNGVLRVNGSVSVPERLSSGGGPLPQQPPLLPTSVTHDKLDSSADEEVKDSGPKAATKPNRPNGLPSSRPNLNLNLSSDSPNRKARQQLTLNFGCAALTAVGEKVDPQLALEKQGWYHGSISRVDAEGKLRVLKEGSYLVRNSESSKQDYSLSLRSARGFMHMKIVPTSEGRFILGQFSNPFSSIPEMIQHYSVNKLPIKGAEHMSLLYPVIDQLL